jgi:hypothetical protein
MKMALSININDHIEKDDRRTDRWQLCNPPPSRQEKKSEAEDTTFQAMNADESLNNTSIMVCQRNQRWHVLKRPRLGSLRSLSV